MTSPSHAATLDDGTMPPTSRSGPTLCAPSPDEEAAPVEEALVKEATAAEGAAPAMEEAKAAEAVALAEEQAAGENAVDVGEKIREVEVEVVDAAGAMEEIDAAHAVQVVEDRDDAEVVVVRATGERLELRKNPANATGYLGVRMRWSSPEARWHFLVDSKHIYVKGYSLSARDAAIAYARGAAAIAAPWRAPMAASEDAAGDGAVTPPRLHEESAVDGVVVLAFQRDAEVVRVGGERLVLHRSDNRSGYVGVVEVRDEGGVGEDRVGENGGGGEGGVCYRVQSSRFVVDGTFATAREAAIARARRDPNQSHLQCGRRQPRSALHRACAGAVGANRYSSATALASAAVYGDDYDEAEAELAATEAVQQAEEAGLELVRSATSNSGYTCVRMTSSGRFQASMRCDGAVANIGSFRTPEQAALALARAKREHGMEWRNVQEAETAATDALQEAKAEGLTLQRSARQSATGYAGVVRSRSGRFKASRWHASTRKKVPLGNYGTAEAAALAVARYDRANGMESEEELAADEVEEAVRQAEAEVEAEERARANPARRGQHEARTCGRGRDAATASVSAAAAEDEEETDYVEESEEEAVNEESAGLRFRSPAGLAGTKRARNDVSDIEEACGTPSTALAVPASRGIAPPAARTASSRDRLEALELALFGAVLCDATTPDGRALPPSDRLARLEVELDLPTRPDGVGLMQRLCRAEEAAGEWL